MKKNAYLKLYRAIPGIVEPLERRLFLTATTFTSSDYFPTAAGRQSLFAGEYVTQNKTFMTANEYTASDSRTSSASTVGSTPTVTLSDLISYDISPGNPTTVTQTADFAVDGNGLEMFGEGYTAATGPMHLMNALAQTGDVITWSNVNLAAGTDATSSTDSGTSKVVGQQTITLIGGQSVTALEIVVDHTIVTVHGSMGIGTTGDDVSTTHYVRKYWLEQGVGIVQFDTNTLSDSTVSGARLQTEVDEAFTLNNASSGTAASLAFGQEPNSTPVTVAISPAVTVAVLDADGNIVTGDNSTVSISVLDGPAGGTVSGTSSVTATHGVARFSNLTFNIPGHYTLMATTGGLVAHAVATAFDVAPTSIYLSADGFVGIIGTGASDTIAGGLDPTDSGKYYFLVETAGQPTVEKLFDTADVHQVEIWADPVGGTGGANDNDLVNLGGDDFGFPVSINGGAGSDTIIGQNGGNVIVGGVGSSRDQIFGGLGADNITSNGRNDTIRSGGGADEIIATMDNALVAGGKDGSNITGDGQGDTLIGGRGNATITAGSSSDLIIGGTGNDSISDVIGGNTVIAGSGQTTVHGSGHDFIDAGWDADLRLQGEAAMPGAAGGDVVGVNGANATLAGNTGSPTLTGASSGFNSFDVNNPAATLQNVNVGNFVAQNDTITSATQTITVHLSIAVVNNGNTYHVAIPSGAGAAPAGTSAAQTTDAIGTIVFQSNGARTFVLGDFFNHWGMNFTAKGIGQFVAATNSGNALSMTVNGVNSTDFNAYQVQNGDTIVITVTV